MVINIITQQICIQKSNKNNFIIEMHCKLSYYWKKLQMSLQSECIANHFIIEITLQIIFL